jgi:hypothetical protein
VSEMINDTASALWEVARQVEKSRAVLEKIYGRMETLNLALEDIAEAINVGKSGGE